MKRSSSPSLSKSCAPFPQLTYWAANWEMPARSVMSSNMRPPRFRYMRLYLESETKRSTLPSLSKSANTGPMAEVFSPFCPNATEIPLAVVVEIGEHWSHGGSILAVLSECHAGLRCDLPEGPVALVVQQKVLALVVGDVDIRIPIKVEVRGRDA